MHYILEYDGSLGSFLHAVIYYIQGKHPGIKFNWVLSTLNIHKKCNLLDVAFLKSIVDEFGNKPVDMITEDGGINCIDSPKIQEELSFQLILHKSLATINRSKSNVLSLVHWMLFW
uniref:Uncharacterized protein n=1 Tax=Tetranychus urticae TaxID=32264 RepID=T1KPV8_TETUR